MKKFKKEARKSAPRDKDTDEPESRLKSETKHGIIVVGIFAVTVLVVLSLFDWAGSIGKGIDTALRYGFGWGRYVVPVIGAVIGFFYIRSQRYSMRSMNYVGLGLFILSFTGLLHLIFIPFAEATTHFAEGTGGGYSGLLLSYIFQKWLGPWAGGIILFALLVVSMLIMFDVSLRRLYESGNVIKRLMRRFGEFRYRLRSNMQTTTDSTEDETVHDGETDAEFGVKRVAKEAQADANDDESKGHDAVHGNEEQMDMFPEKKKVPRKKIDIPIDLLESSNTKPLSGDIEAHKEKIQKTLVNFGIEVEMGDTQVGPTVTQYSLKPAEGVKLSQITTLSNDLSLALAAHPIRIEAPIPGKSLVGIEVPNEAVAVVKLKDILMSSEFKKRKSKLTVGLGRDVAGHAWLADIDPMPHLLIAGATGSGKSVCLNAVLLSLLYQNSPDELKLILIDPKRVELSVYNSIPHLITPVINEIDKAINALRWVVAEMDRRFQLLSKTGHRNIHAYNRDNGDTMTYLVIAIDEMADLMSVAANEVEAAIIRLAQMARAVGIHLILATQRPSVDIITGLIKANITTRIAFSVASSTDSRTILDTSGADKLLGRGDMLYISSQLSKPKRLQGAYVTDQEISRVTSFLKEKDSPEYQEEVIEKVVDQTLVGNFEDLCDDELLDQAKELVITAGKASASYLQRRLRIGYARAARLLDILEEQGVIGPGEGAKPREILIAGEEECNEEEHGDLPVENEGDGNIGDQDQDEVDDEPEEEYRS